MATTVITGTIDDSDGFNIANGDDHFFTSTSFIRATGVNDEAITVENGADVRSVVTVAGDVIGNRVGVELDGSDVLFVTQGAVVRDERAFGIRTLNGDNHIVVAGFVGGNDSGVELDGDNDRLTITESGVVSGAADEDIIFRPAGVNMRGQNNILENAGTIVAGQSGAEQPAVTNRESIFGDDEDELDATVINTGEIFGDVLLFAGTDTYDARGGGFVSGTVDLGNGDDLFRGGTLAERALGGAGADRMTGGGGNDDLSGAAGEDRISGGDGDDDIEGGADADRLFGDAGEDDLTGGGGDDLMRGGADADVLTGGDGNDSMFGNSGDDEQKGGGGADDMSGGSGDDTLLGGNGTDTITGGTGDDVMTGGRGGDTFVFRPGFGNDVVRDFADGNTEKLDLSGIAAISSFADLVNNHLSQDDGDAIITVGDDSIRLEGFAAADLDAGDVIL